MNDVDPEPMELHGQALLDYVNGECDGTMLLHRDDGFTYPSLPVREWFYESGLPEIDGLALDLCRGVVLDVGASSGAHSLALQERGENVIALEVSRSAVEVMRRRGVRQVIRGSIFDPVSPRVDTVLVLNNIGIVEHLDGLERFLEHIKTFLRPGGRLITDSIDPRSDQDSEYLAYRQRKVAQGRYEGERTLCFEYKGRRSRWFEWMHVAFDPLIDRATRAGFECEEIARECRRFLCLLEWPG